MEKTIAKIHEKTDFKINIPTLITYTIFIATILGVRYSLVSKLDIIEYKVSQYEPMFKVVMEHETKIARVMDKLGLD